MNLYDSALFYADKVATISHDDPKDIFWVAQCMFHLKEYQRAALAIRSRQLDKSYLVFKYLAAKCKMELREYSDALDILNMEEGPTSETPLRTFEIEGDCDIKADNLNGSILLLKARIYEAMDNRTLACELYKQALKTDVHCFEAFQTLVQHEMLTASEERDLLASLPLKEQCSTIQEEKIVRTTYECLMKKYQTAASESAAVAHPDLEENFDILVSKAERLYYLCFYRKSIAITNAILEKDPYYTSCLPVHIACLMELCQKNSLYYLAQDLVGMFPDSAVSWYAVGCYHFIKGKTDLARKFLGKATTIDKFFGPAWVAYGHTFAVEDEHDQAMAAYFKASEFMKGCHLPLLYIGVECGETNNVQVAEKFFNKARAIAPDDPFVLHEMGVVAFQRKQFKLAETYFERALELVGDINEKIVPFKWEPLYNNLGHTYRKLKKYEKAIKLHQQTISLSPMEYTIYASIGFCQALLGRNESAAESFHKALSLRGDDTFSTNMLNFILEQMKESSQCYYVDGSDSEGEWLSYEEAIAKGSSSLVPLSTDYYAAGPSKSTDEEMELANSQDSPTD